jgi:hypothetical protein
VGLQCCLLLLPLLLQSCRDLALTARVSRPTSTSTKATGIYDLQGFAGQRCVQSVRWLESCLELPMQRQPPATACSCTRWQAPCFKELHSGNLCRGAAAGHLKVATHLMRHVISGTTGSIFCCTSACPGRKASLPAAGTADAAVCLSQGTAAPSSTSRGSCWSKASSTVHTCHLCHENAPKRVFEAE